MQTTAVLSEQQKAVGRRLARLIEQRPDLVLKMQSAIKAWCGGEAYRDDFGPRSNSRLAGLEDIGTHRRSPRPIDLDRPLNSPAEDLVMVAAAYHAYCPDANILPPVFDLENETASAFWPVMVRAAGRMPDDLLSHIYKIANALATQFSAVDISVVPTAALIPALLADPKYNARWCVENPITLNEAPEFIKREKYGYTPDFSRVEWFGNRYKFKVPQQRRIVGLLMANFENGKHGMSSHSLWERVSDPEATEEKNFRVDSIFRNHPAFKRKDNLQKPMIVRGDGMAYYLQGPDKQ